MRDTNFETLKRIEFTQDDLVNLADCFSIIHHSPGRIRLRASLKLKDLANSVDSSDFNNLFDTINALPMIKHIKINKLIGSVTIEYDPKKFDSTLWEKWIEKSDIALVYSHIRQILEDL